MTDEVPEVREGREANPDYVPKHGVPVRLIMNGGEERLGVLYLSKRQRLLEMLCDQRPFVPFRSGANLFFINKAGILQVEILSPSFVAERSHFFPGVDVDAMKASLISTRGAFEVSR